MTARWQERLGIAAVLLCLTAVPVFGVYVQRHNDRLAVGDRDDGGTVRVFHLTGIAKPGMWTLDTVVGHNYWRRTPRRLEEIRVRKGDTVVLTLTSADVEHGFVIPALGIGPLYGIEPGHRKVVKFKADRAGVFPFLCAKVCSCTGPGFACTLAKKDGHEGMTGVIRVEEELGQPDTTVAVTISEDRGFEPDVIRVQQGDVVEIRVTSETDGIGDGVGFCISDYETQVDLPGIKAGESATFRFKADKAGTFIIYSSTVAGDEIDSAMATFIVEGAQPGSNASPEAAAAETEEVEAEMESVSADELEGLAGEFEGL
ncbi:MAG: hypothetical protein ACE5O2_09125 [Armatimonadota bacterium]